MIGKQAGWAAALAACLGAAAVLARGPGRERASADAPVQIAGELQRGAVRLVQEPIVLAPEDERRIGRELLASFRREPEDEVVTLYVRDVFSALAGALGESPYRFEIHVAADSVPNAFALPGGILVVTRGLVEGAGSEAELAAAIGHEIMHVQGGHWREALKGRAALERVGLGDLASAASLVYRVLEAGFSEAQELEADRGGVELAARAGYAPRAAEILFERLEAREQPAPSERTGPVRRTAELLAGAVRRYFESHPPAAQRVEAVRQVRRDRRSAWEGRTFYWGRRNLEQLVARDRRAWDDEWDAADVRREP